MIARTERTSGPWHERIATGDGARVIYDGNGRPVCEIPIRFGTPESRAADSRRIRALDANQQTIAKLVAALREIKDGDGYGPLALREIARAALAKAEGSQS